MKNLRHVSGSNLKRLEAQVEELSKTHNLALLGVTHTASNWYIHFTVDAFSGEPKKRRGRPPKTKQT